MKLLRVAALLAPMVMALPLSAHAAMDSSTKAKYMSVCKAAAAQSNPAMDAKAVEAHCECGAQQIDTKLSDKQIASLNDEMTPQDKAMTSDLQKAVAEHCLPGKK